MTLRHGTEPVSNLSPAQAEARRAHDFSDAYAVSEICDKMGNYQLGLSFLRQAEVTLPDDEFIHFQAGKFDLKVGDTGAARVEQKQIVKICESKDKFLTKQCEAYSSELLRLIEQSSR